MEQKKIEPIRDARKLGKAKMLILGIQHMFAMFGATILVPILVSGYFQAACGEELTRGLSVSVTLFCAGFGTLIFHLCTKFKVPAFLGSSFAFLGGFYTVANLDSGMYAGMSANDKAAYACGGIFVAGMLYFVLALIIKLVGVNRVMKFLPPVVTGPIIICIGLSLAGSAITNASANWLLAFVALAVIIIFNIWGKGLFKIMSKMGISTIRSYRGAKIFEAIGLSEELSKAYFGGLGSPIGGIRLEEVARDAIAFHNEGFAAEAGGLLPNKGLYSFRKDGEKHAWNLIKLDKEWYHADLTWDDPEPDETSRIMYTYFNVDDTQMKADHKWNAALYQKAEGNEYNYYRKKDLLCEDYKSFRSKCEDILEKKSPNSIQFMVKDYDQDTYSDDNLQFILRYSGASSLRMQIAGKTPYTMLYFKLQY